ncbi:MAG: hypothetical protein KatS3mg129_1338 [Leptospiraceae bacterium]|nr:MAG: hypothetical protein KatS3mg129_1338 [Leptospiraceae bacterium]
MNLKKILDFVVFPILFYLVIFIIIFNKVFMGEYHFINHDNFIQFYVSFIKTTLWDPNLGYGFPIYGDPQWQIFYPFRYFFPKTLNGFDYYLLHFLIIGAYFTFLTAYELTQKFIPSFIAGLIYSLSGSMAGQMSMLSVPATSSYLPAIFYFFYKLLYEKSKIKWMLGFTFSISLGFLSGQPQFFIYIVLFLGFFYIFYILNNKIDNKIYKISFLVLFSSLLGILLVSFSFFSIIEANLVSLRSSKIPFDKFNDYEFLIRNIIHLFFPYFLGGIHPDQLFAYIYPENYAISHNFHEQFRYFGLLPWFLIFFSIRLVKQKEVKNFFIFCLLFYFLWALGTQTLISKILYYIPIINRLRGPSRHFLEITFIIALLTSIGLSNLKQILKYHFIYIIILFSIVISLPFIYFFLYPELLEKYVSISYNIFSIYHNNGLILQFFLLFLIFLVLVIYKFYDFKFGFNLFLLGIILIDLGFNLQGIDALVYASKKDIWYRADKEYKQIASYFDSNKNFRYYISNTCISYDIYECSNIPFLNNINTLYNIPSSSVYNPLVHKYIAGLNLLFSNKKDLLPYWNIGLDVQNLYTNDIFQGQILLIIPDKTYKLMIPNIIINQFNKIDLIKTNLFFSIYTEKEKLKKGDPVLEINIPDINYKKVLIYPTDIDFYIDNCKKAKYKKKLVDKCLHLYNEEILIKNKNHIIFLKSLLKKSILSLHSITLSSPQNENTQKTFHGNAFYIPESHNISTINFDRYSKKVFYNNVIPRAYFAKSIEYIKQDELLNLLFLDKNFIINTNLIERSFIHSNLLQKNNFLVNNTSIEWLISSDYYLKLKTFNKNEGFLVLLDLYYPSWKAFIDNKEVPIYPVNIIGRGIFVPAGEHIIEFKFYPKSLIIGIIVSILSFIALGVFIYILTQKKFEFKNF